MMKLSLAAMVCALGFTLPLAAQSIDFGDDSGQYTRDGECDDRRFFGPGIAVDIDNTNIGRDATDCRAGFEAGTISLWDYDEAKAATSCSAINFGNDTSEYANDFMCDDPRFEGMGTASVLLDETRGHDASDCRQLCEMGVLFVRNHGTY